MLQIIKDNWEAIEKGLLWAFWTLLIGGGVLIITSVLLEERMAKAAIAELKRVLKTDFELEKASLSLIWGFPQASLSLQNLRLKGQTDTSQLLLEAQTLTLKCGIVGMFSGNYMFRELDIRDAKLYLAHSLNDSCNYDIFQKQTDSKFPIERISARNVQLIYQNQHLDAYARVQISSGAFTGFLGEPLHTIRSRADFLLDSLAYRGLTCLQQQPMIWDGDLETLPFLPKDSVSRGYTCQNGRLEIQHNKFEVKATIQDTLSSLAVDWDMNNQKARLEHLVALLDTNTQTYLKGFESEPNLFVEAHVHGFLTPRYSPQAWLKIISNGTAINHPKIPFTFQNTSFEFFATNQNPEDKPFCELKNLEMDVDKEHLQVNFSLLGYPNPLLTANLNGSLPTETWFRFLGARCIEGSGFINFFNLRLKGFWADMQHSAHAEKVELLGDLSFEDFYLLVDKIVARVQKGKITLKGNTATLQNLQIETPKTHIGLNLQLENLLPVLTHPGDTNSLGINGSAHFQKLNMEEWEQLTQLNYPILQPLLQKMRGTCILNIVDLQAWQFLAKQVNGSLEFKKGLLQADSFLLQTMSGQAQLQGEINLTPTPTLTVLGRAQGLDIQALFAQFGNFNQTQLTDQNLRGRLTGAFKSVLAWDTSGQIIPKERMLWANLSLREGELINAFPFYELSEKLRLKDFQNIRFTEIGLQLQILGEKVEILAGVLHGHFGNWIFAGAQNPKNTQYFLKLHTGQVLVDKLRHNNAHYTPLKSITPNEFNLYMSLTGNEHLSLGADAGAVKKHLSEAFSSQAPRLEAFLQNEFLQHGFQLPATPPFAEPAAWQDLPAYGEN